MNLHIFRESIQQIKKIETIVVNALLLAMNTVLGAFSIMIGEFIRIGFSFLTLATAGMLYGPVIGGLFGGIGDLINYIVRPNGPYFPGFTLNSILTGVIYGLFFYQKKITLKRTILAKLIITIFIDLILTTNWLSILYGQAFMVLLPMRIIKSTIMFSIDVGLLYLVLTRINLIIPKLINPNKR
ncbi:MAG: folate family ECF transporter S component [Anaerocolumna sp.]